MRTTYTIATILLAGILAHAGGDTWAVNVAAKDFRIFSGEPRLIVVNGYSTSFHWWAFLQRKTDRQF